MDLKAYMNRIENPIIQRMISMENPNIGQTKAPPREEYKLEFAKEFISF